MPGRPRDEVLDVEIWTAARDLLKDVGYDRFSIGGVASRAHVPRSTVYSRWTTKTDLLDSVLCRNLVEGHPTTRDLRSALIELLEEDMARARSTEGRAVAQLMLASRDPSGPPAQRSSAAFSERRREYLDILDRHHRNSRRAESAVDIALSAAWGQVVTNTTGPDPSTLADLIISMSRTPRRRTEAGDQPE
jgi:AcrR family transcriptional regulator